MTRYSSEINTHLYHIAELEHSDDPEAWIKNISHRKAIFDLTEDGDSNQAFQALKLAYNASIPLPIWATQFFKSHINGKNKLPRVVSENSNEMLEIRKRRDACECVLKLIDVGVFEPSQYGHAQSLLKILNQYWVNGGPRGTSDNPLDL